WMQSDSNPSPPSNSLLTGKLTGNFAKFSISHEFKGMDTSKSNGLRRNSLRTEQGIISGGTGNSGSETGNLFFPIKSKSSAHSRIATGTVGRPGRGLENVGPEPAPITVHNLSCCELRTLTRAPPPNWPCRLSIDARFAVVA